MHFFSLREGGRGEGKGVGDFIILRSWPKHALLPGLMYRNGIVGADHEARTIIAIKLWASLALPVGSFGISNCYNYSISSRG